MNTPQTQQRQLHILTELCNLPTAPYQEQHVIDWLLRWAAAHPRTITTRRDKAGNVYLTYRRGPARKNPLVIEAHMDHPGFTTTRQKRDGTLEALFRGGVKPSHFKNATAQFRVGDRWIPARVRSIKTIPNHRHMLATLGPVKEKIPPNTLGMWNLPDARIKNNLFAARVCDDLAGIAAIVALLEALIAKKVDAHIIGLCSRAEEVGFAGVLAICENRWLPKNSPVIGLETSKAFPTTPQGAGPIIRVGDRTGIFSPGLTHFITQAAGRISDDHPAFKYQRKLMDGGTCNSTAFAAYDYDSAGICLALGNYHNMNIKGDIGYKSPGTSTAGPGIASETIHTEDFTNMIHLLVEIATRIHKYKPGLAIIRNRLSTMHAKEQKALLCSRR